MTAPAAPGASPDPELVGRAIVALLRIMPGPAADPAASPRAVAEWLAAKADLLERIATATADPGLAVHAALCASRALAAARPLACPGSPSPDLGSTEGAPR